MSSGIADDIKQRGLQRDPGLFYYRAAWQWYDRSATVVVRTRGHAADLADDVRQTLQGEMPGASYVRVTPLAETFGRQLQSWRLGATMFVAVGGLALALAAIGLYSVVSYSVAQRTHELGVLRALGARSGDVVGLVLRQGVTLGAIGVTIGVVATLALSDKVASMLFEVSPHDPAIYGFVAAAMLVVAVLASVIPAIRAANVDRTSHFGRTEVLAPGIRPGHRSSPDQAFFALVVPPPVRAAHGRATLSSPTAAAWTPHETPAMQCVHARRNDGL